MDQTTTLTKQRSTDDTAVMPNQWEMLQKKYNDAWRRGEDPDVPDEWLMGAQELAEIFSWGIPNDKAIETLAAIGPIVEIGAGTGYWASLISQAGGDVVAYDKHKRTDWFPVRVGGPEMVTRHPNRTLFLCWPPYNKSMAFDSLQRYRGNVLVYVGETDSTADTKFWELLTKDWQIARKIKLPNWDDGTDLLRVYVRS